MSIKKPNRLAHLIDHQSFAGSALPRSLSNNFARYEQATTEFKALMVDCLPDEIISTCYVVGLTAETITISVLSSTAANHILYLQKAYLTVLTNQSITFKQLKKIRVILVAQFNLYTKVSDQTATTKSHSDSNRTYINRELSQKTKKTISQALEHVIIDKNLENALRRLINE